MSWINTLFFLLCERAHSVNAQCFDGVPFGTCMLTEGGSEEYYDCDENNNVNHEEWPCDDCSVDCLNSTNANETSVWTLIPCLRERGCLCNDCNTTNPTASPSTAPSYAPTVFNVTNTSGPPTMPEIQGFDANTAEFMFQLKITIPAAIAILFLFCILRRAFPMTFELRRKLSLHIVPSDSSSPSPSSSSPCDKVSDLLGERQPVTFPPLSKGFFVWMLEVWTMDSNTFYHHAGFDALVFRLYLKGCGYICMAAMPYALCVLLPVYGTSENFESTPDPIDKLSLKTVAQGSPRLYAAVIGSYVFTLIALYSLSKVYLAVAYATDQFLIGARRLEDIDNISWLNYRHAIDHIIDFSINGAKRTRSHLKKGTSKLFDRKHPVETRYYGYSTTMPSSPTLTFRGFSLRHRPKGKSAVSELDIGRELEDMDKVPRLSIDELEQIIPPIDRYTVMIRDLPRQFRDGEKLRDFLNDLFPDKIAHVTIVPDVHRLKQMDAQIKRCNEKLAKLSTKYAFSLDALYRDDQLPVVMERPKCCGRCGATTNIIAYHREKRDALIVKFNEKRRAIKPSPTAFVIFNSLVEASNCVSSPIRFGLSTLKISKAPYPKDLYWSNLKFKTNKMLANNFLVGVAMFFLLIFWSIPVAAIQALANLDELFELFHGDAERTLGSKERVATMQGLLAVLILDLWLGILPLIAEILTFFQRKGYRGKHEMLVMTKYFDCLVFMVLLVTVISGSALNNAHSFSDYAHNIVDSISEIVNHLANGLSDMSCYFLLYVLLNAFLWIPIEMFRPVYWCMHSLKLPEPNRFHYSVWYSKTMLILTILMTYGVMNPIMWVLGLVYFMLAAFVFTYNLSMNWVPEFETGAKMWPLVFGRLRFSFMISIFTLFGFITLQQSYVCAALLLPLAGFVWWVTGNLDVKFRTIFRATSLTSARSKDKQITELINNGEEDSSAHLGDPEKLKYVYLPPIMSVEHRLRQSPYAPPKFVSL